MKRERENKTHTHTIMPLFNALNQSMLSICSHLMLQSGFIKCDKDNDRGKPRMRNSFGAQAIQT